MPEKYRNSENTEDEILRKIKKQRRSEKKIALRQLQTSQSSNLADLPINFAPAITSIQNCTPLCSSDEIIVEDLTAPVDFVFTQDELMTDQILHEANTEDLAGNFKYT